MKNKIEDYKKQISATHSVVKLYHELSILEQQNMVDTDEYQMLFDLLPDLIKLEKRKYHLDRTLLKELSKKSINKKFISFEQSLDVLVDIRSLNRVGEDEIYTLDGNVFQENFDARKNLEKSNPELYEEIMLLTLATADGFSLEKSLHETQEIIEEALYKRINYILKHINITESERKILIETKYAILATSKTLETKLLNDELRMNDLPELTPFEKQQVTQNLVAKVSKVEDRALQVSDEEFERENAIAQLLYVDTCLLYMDNMYSAIIRQECINSINLNGFYGQLQNISKEKMCELMRQVFIGKYFYKRKDEFEKK